jgi:hypothetical protein
MNMKRMITISELKAATEVISKYCKEVEALKAKNAEMSRQGKPIEIIQQVKMDDFDKVGKWQIGDIIRFTLLTGEEVEAQCQRVDPEGATFCLTHCLEEEQQMNEENTNEGGWDESYLRKYLNTEILNSFPESIRSRMRPVYKDDLLTLPAVEDIFGEWDFDRWEPKEDAEPNWPLMKHRQYRAKGNCWWERSAYCNNAAYFCSVDTSGAANTIYASRSYGLAPTFLIANPDCNRKL